MNFEYDHVMQLSSRQKKTFKLVSLLAPGKPVATTLILEELKCSLPTLTRVLKDVRDSYDCEIEYISPIHSYHLVSRGALNSKTIKKVNEALLIVSAQTVEGSGKRAKVILDKEKKKSTSFSLRMDCIKKINQLANVTGFTRSDIIEMLVDSHIYDLETRIINQT